LEIFNSVNTLLMNPLKFWLKTLTLFSFFFVVAFNNAAQQSAYVSDVIGVEENMLYANYWTSKLSNSDIELLSATQIRSGNEQLFKTNNKMMEIAQYPKSQTAAIISAKIQKISSPASSPRFYSDGQLVTKANYDTYNQALNLSGLPRLQTIKFGLVVRRTNMRTFPTSDKIYKTTTSTNLDRFQETALFPTEAVAVLHESLDKKWFFAVSYNYTAWVKKEDIALGDREQIINYKNSNDFLVVSGSKIYTSFNPENESISELQLEMGTVLPLVEGENIPTTIAGQNTYASYVVYLPVRDLDGKLIIQAALISRSDDVHRGYLAYTQDNIIKQSFKFLGERYGWGHSFNARDCTGFIGEVFKSFGILMPRNSGDQGLSEQGINTRFLKTASESKKMKSVGELSVGDLIYIPGHVMMVLGHQDDKPFIIHDVSGMSYFKENGDYYKSSLNGVSITPLLTMQLSQDKSYLDKIYNIKKIK